MLDKAFVIRDLHFLHLKILIVLSFSSFNCISVVIAQSPVSFEIQIIPFVRTELPLESLSGQIEKDYSVNCNCIGRSGMK